MQKPSNYDNTSTGDFTPIELGGHHLTIKGVKESKSKTDKDMIVVAFDFAKNDKQPGYFSKLFREDIRPEKKWPNAGTSYILVNDDKGECSRNFKRFITAVEKSNKGFVTAWGDSFEAQFKAKAVGGVFGIVEEEYNGERKKRHKLRWFCEDDKVESAEIPEARLMPDSNVSVSAPKPAADGFMSIPDGADEEIPF